MSRRLPLDLMWSLNPIELQGIVVRPSLPHSTPPPHNPPTPLPSPRRRFCAPGFPPPPPLLSSSSSTPPKQNFFKCLIFPPLASFLQAPSHLFVHRFFIPLQPLPPSASFPSSSSTLSASCLSPQLFVCISPVSPALFCCWCKLIYLFILSLLPR